MFNVSLFDDKIAEITTRIQQLTVDETISKNTRSTQLFAKRRERKVLQALKFLVDKLPENTEIPTDIHDTLVSLTTLQAERVQATKIEISLGMSLVEIFQKYADVKDLNRKMQKILSENHWRISGNTGKVVEDK